VKAAGSGADRVGRDHWDSLVEGFVGDQAPRLAEVARGDGRYDHNVGARVEVAQRLGTGRACEHGRAGGDGPGSDRAAADQNQRG